MGEPAISLTRPQRHALRSIADGRSELAHACSVAALKRKGLVRWTTREGVRLTDMGVFVLGVTCG